MVIVQSGMLLVHGSHRIGMWMMSKWRVDGCGRWIGRWLRGTPSWKRWRGLRA
jgi:hypothetical protein